MKYGLVVAFLALGGCLPKSNETSLFKWDLSIETEGGLLGIGTVGDSDRSIILLGNFTNKKSVARKKVILRVEYFRDGQPLAGHPYLTEVSVENLGPSETRHVSFHLGHYSSDWKGVTPRVSYLRHEDP